MSRYSSAFLHALPVAAALLWIAPVHAAENWLDKAFTFREDQKANIAPNRSVKPRIVQQPYYPPAQHEAWTNFYTRQDLEPEDYLSSSASKVMRPVQPLPQVRAAQTPAQADGGFSAIAEQAAANAQAEDASDTPMVIGDPGDSPLMRDGNAQVGRATTIGAPLNDWRNPAEGDALRSRPGDYDYRGSVTVSDQGVAVGEPKVKWDNSAAQPESLGAGTPDALKNDPRYVGFNAKGQVTKYAVQKGDTLGNISAQPAIYNTWKLWPLIYSANRKAIGRNPHDIDVGQKLGIPRDYTKKQANEAERKSGM